MEGKGNVRVLVKGGASLTLPKSTKLTDRLNPLWGLPFEEIHRVLYGTWEDRFQATQALLSTPNREYEKHVERICDKQRFKATYHVFRVEKGVDGLFQCVLILDGVPCLHTCGSGNTPEEARCHAAYEAVRCFITLTRPLP